MLKYLKLTRAHTVPLEAVPAMIGTALAEGTLLSIHVLLWGMFGVLYHLAGYGHNSVTDWINGYDKDDPNKQHHPLNAGELSPETAEAVVNVLLVITVLYAYTYVLVLGSYLAGAALTIGLIFGLLYNLQGKETHYKFLYISAAHTSVFAVPYLALGGDHNAAPFTIGVIFMFLWVVFQISVSGEVKDITQDESNFLKNLGARVNRKYIRGQKKCSTITFSKECRHYAKSIKMLNVVAAVAILILLDASIIPFIILVFAAVYILHNTVSLLKDTTYYNRSILHQPSSKNRMEKVRYMSKIEAWTLVMFVVSFTPVIGVYGLLLVAASSLWIVIGNKLLWGTYIAPEV